MDIIYGRRPVLEALRGRRPVLELYLVEETSGSRTLDEIVDLAAGQKVPVSRASKEVIGRLAGGALHQGIVARVAPYRYGDLQDVLARAEKKDEALIVVLDGVVDPQNLRP